MTKILVVGDSITFGAGLALENDDPRLWVNQLVAQTFTQYKLTNLAEIGRNNQWIFNESASELLTNDYDIAIIGWSEISRFNFDIGTTFIFAYPFINCLLFFLCIRFHLQTAVILN